MSEMIPEQFEKLRKPATTSMPEQQESAASFLGLNKTQTSLLEKIKKNKQTLLSQIEKMDIVIAQLEKNPEFEETLLSLFNLKHF